MLQLSDVHYSVMQLLAECGWVSRPLLEFFGYSNPYQTRCLKTLLDQRLIRKQGKGVAKSYALAARGRNHLAAYNARRFRAEVMELNRQLSRHPDRAMLRGDAAAMLSFAGYAVHPDDKPSLPAYTPPLPESPGRGYWQGLCQNAIQTTYPGETDKRLYIRRQSAVNCYYDATVLKGLTPRSEDKDNEGVNYSRACGVLMTPSYLLRVYHSRDVAMKFHVTGERNFRALLLSDFVFSGYVPLDRDGVLIFGDDFTAAAHIIEHNLYGYSSRLPAYVKRAGGKKGYEPRKGTSGEMLTPTNLGKPAFYLPLRAESLELLQLMRFPFWQEAFLREINRELFGLLDQPRWCFQCEAYMAYILAALNLTQIDVAFRSIRNTPEQKVRIICLHWQEEFFRALLEPFAGKRSIWLTRLPADYLAGQIGQLEDDWR